MLGETFNIDQSNKAKRILLTLAIFVPAVAILVFAKNNPAGFNILWRYFAWTNQTVAIFALALVTIYLKLHAKNYWIALVPGMFYTFIITSYILHAPIGLNLDKLVGLEPDSYMVSYLVALVLTMVYGWYTLKLAKARKDYILKTVLV